VLTNEIDKFARQFSDC